MQELKVAEFYAPDNGGIKGAIEPEDKSWVLLLDEEGTPYLWRRALDMSKYPNPTSSVEEGLHTMYYDVELPGAVTVRHPLEVLASLPVPNLMVKDPLDYTIEPAKEPKMDAIDAVGHAEEDRLYPDRRDGFLAMLNCRSVGFWGETEHAAIKGLLNGVAVLCSKGYLDFTGRPMRVPSGRRALVVESLVQQMDEENEVALSPEGGQPLPQQPLTRLPLVGFTRLYKPRENITG